MEIDCGISICGSFFPPGGTHRLYGRQDARRYGAADAFGSGGRPVCRGGRHLAARKEREMFYGGLIDCGISIRGSFFPPGGTHRLYGRQDARRYGVADAFGSGGRPVCRGGRHLAARKEREMFYGGLIDCGISICGSFFPPGGTHRLYGRQDARRYNKKRAAPKSGSYGKQKQTIRRLSLFAAQGHERGQTAQTGQRQRGGFRNYRSNEAAGHHTVVTKVTRRKRVSRN